MFTDAGQLSVKQAYALLTSTVVPRPIAWISTTNAAGHINLAPFSYFQALCSDPPMLTVSITAGRGGGVKDTLRLLRETGHCGVHLVEEHDLARMNLTSAELPPDDSEATYANVETAPWPGLPIARITSSRAAFACKLVDEHHYGNAHGVTLVVCEIVAVWTDPAIVDVDGAVVGGSIHPVARLGGTNYALLGERPSLARPKV